jgi:protein-tyrosine phosphatase
MRVFYLNSTCYSLVNRNRQSFRRHCANNCGLSRKEENIMYKFGSASTDELIIFGSARPGYTNAQVKKWINFMQQQGIKRVCCLLAKSQMDLYSDLLSIYQDFFGVDRICWVPIEDFHLVDLELFTHQILPFLLVADSRQERVVVHCSGGIGRTGHILSAWLVAGRGLSPKLAIDTVKKTGRNPYEAIVFAPFIGRNPCQVTAELKSLLNECSRRNVKLS